MVNTASSTIMDLVDQQTSLNTLRNAAPGRPDHPACGSGPPGPGEIYSGNGLQISRTTVECAGYATYDIERNWLEQPGCVPVRPEQDIL